MERLTIRCLTCAQDWLAAVTFSIYQQQAVESCPCPYCGAYTVCCSGQDQKKSAKRKARKPALTRR